MPNRTLGIMENLRFLRSLNNERIDLIAIAPPFAVNETFVAPCPPAPKSRRKYRSPKSAARGMTKGAIPA